MIAFLNSLLNYIMLFVVFTAVAGIGIFVGIVMRKSKNKATEAEAVESETV